MARPGDDGRGHSGKSAAEAPAPEGRAQGISCIIYFRSEQKCGYYCVIRLYLVYLHKKQIRTMDEKDILLKTIEGLNTYIASLSATNKNQEEQIKNLQERIKELTAQIAWLNR